MKKAPPSLTEFVAAAGYEPPRVRCPLCHLPPALRDEIDAALRAKAITPRAIDAYLRAHHGFTVQTMSKFRVINHRDRHL